MSRRYRTDENCSALIIKTMGYTNKELISMLEDVVTVLDLSDDIVDKHGPLGTAPADLVRMVLEQKDKQIRMLRLGMKQIEPAS